MIQIDVDMPKNCEYCPLVRHYQNGNVWCNGKNLLMYNTTRTPPMATRPGWCPLIDVPEMNVGKIGQMKEGEKSDEKVVR